MAEMPNLDRLSGSPPPCCMWLRLYFGSGEFVVESQRHTFQTDKVFVVSARVEHRFKNFTDDFSHWVMFWEPQVGESNDRSYQLQTH
jgi:hypothetical protein